MPSESRSLENQLLSGSTGLNALGLSTRAYNRLHHAGIHTVEQVAAMSDEDLLAIWHLGVTTLAEIREKLAAYSPADLEPKQPQAPELSPPEPPSVRQASVTDKRPIENLGLSIRPRNALRRGGIITIGQLAQMSSEQILNVPNVGTKSLAEIEEKLKAYLIEHPLPSEPTAPVEPQPSSYSEPATSDKAKRLSLVVDSALADRASRVQLDLIPIRRLGLPAYLENQLHRQGIESIDELIQQLTDAFDQDSLVKRQLGCYVTWLVEQDESTLADEVSDRGISPLHRMKLEETTVDELADAWLSTLDERQQQIIRWRYGLDDEALTLEEVGQRLGLTRERVRQIQAKAKSVLKYRSRRRRIEPLAALLSHLLTEAGGLMNTQQLDAGLRYELTVGAVSPIGLAQLIFDLDDRFKWLPKARAWGLMHCPLAEVDAIQKRLAWLLTQQQSPLGVEELLARFRETRFYKNRRGRLNDAFICACLRVHPRIEVDSQEMCALTRWAKRKVDKISLTLRQIGHPSHYSVIAEQVNALLPPDQQTSARNIHAILDRYADVFVHLGRGRYWLRDQIITEAHTPSQADFGDLFGKQLARWQAELDRRQDDAGFDTHVEVDKIRDVGLDFFGG